MASDPGRRAIFIQSAVEMIQEYGFQGLDMDWEYPTFRGGDDDDKVRKSGFGKSDIFVILFK